MAAEITKVPFIISLEFKSMWINRGCRSRRPWLIQSSKYPEWFYSDALPNVKFNMSVGALANGQMFAVISKMPNDPAKAYIKVKFEHCNEISINSDNWTNNCSVGYTDLPRENWGFHRVSGVCDIRWGGFTEDPDPTPISLYRQMKKFFAEPDFADVEIVVDNTKIPAHKVVLAAQSPVFSTMLRKNMSESANNRINIKDVDVDIMKQVIQFMYAGEIDTKLDIDALLSILSAAEKYQIIDLKQTCAQSLGPKITVENSLKILEATALYRIPQLGQCVKRFMIQCKQEIIELDDYKDLQSRKPEVLLDFITGCIEAEVLVFS